MHSLMHKFSILLLFNQKWIYVLFNCYLSLNFHADHFSSLSFVHVAFALSLEVLYPEKFSGSSYVRRCLVKFWIEFVIYSVVFFTIWPGYELIFASLEIEMLNIPCKHESVIWIFWCLFCWDCIELYSNCNSNSNFRSHCFIMEQDWL